jgi:hypothetical protein
MRFYRPWGSETYHLSMQSAFVRSGALWSPFPIIAARKRAEARSAMILVLRPSKTPELLFCDCLASEAVGQKPEVTDFDKAFGKTCGRKRQMNSSAFNVMVAGSLARA